MSYPITQKDYAIAKQPFRNMFLKVNLLDFNFQTVESLEGSITGGGININAESDIRRTCDITMVVLNSTFNVEVGGKIWLDKFIKVYLGTENIYDGEIQWTNMGIYIINNPDHVFDAVTNTITFQGLDLMAKLTGVRNGYLDGIPTKIEIGANIRNAMISTLALGGFKNYLIADNPQTVPYEILIDRGGTVFDILKALRDISPEYEMFFDVDGVFNYQLIPNGETDPIILNNDVLDKTLISISNNVDFENVKNKIEVWGKSLDPPHFGGNASVSGSQYSITVASLSALTQDLMIGFVAPSIVTTPNLSINSFGAKPIVDEDGTPAIIPLANQYYVVRVRPDGNFLFMGKQQIQATVQDENPDSPYYIGGTTGTILLPLFGGEYDNIVTDDLALQRARYELYLHARLNDAITITSTIIPWLDVNVKMNYKNMQSGVTGDFLVKSVNMNLDVTGIMTFTASRFYPLYPFI
ncbi:MAG: DUF5048 domain-containing protein [Acinetobacter sp.]